MDEFIDIILSIDRTIYSWIPSVYELIVKLAGYEVFSPEQINGLSRRVYALIGIFMLFKLSFSMISYIVNPDDFSDKTKGFGGLIKNVIISMVLIVAVPYIFAEAFYVQRMILEDGTLIKMVLPIAGEGDEENNDRSSIAYANRGAGDQISFVLFTQFAKPNDVIPSIKDGCQKLYKVDEKGNRVHVENSEYAYQLDDKCAEALHDAFGKTGRKAEETYNYYKDAMEYENFSILVNHSEIFKAKYDFDIYTNASDGKMGKAEVSVIKYNWFLCFLIGIVVLLFLITLCIDVAARTIKLAFYQIIAPVPIISNCDPKGKKDGMLQKWTKACISTYLDLFIRLIMFFLAIFIIRAFAQKFASSGNDSAIIVFIIIGALVFAKQAPKIIEDLTGLKIENFTLNPFKKISNEALFGKAALGAIGGAAAGLIGGGGPGLKGLVGRGLSTVGGAVRGGVTNKGFAAGLHAQADVNRKVRDARINGAGWIQSRFAGVASTFGLDDAFLEREATVLRKDLDIVDRERKAIDSKNKDVEIKKKAAERAIAPKQAVIEKQKGVTSAIEAMENKATSFIEGGKAGKFSDFYKQLQGQHLNLNNMKNGEKLLEDIYGSDGEVKYSAGTVIDDKMRGQVSNYATKYAKKEGKAELVKELMETSLGSVSAGGVNENDVRDFKASQATYETSVKIANQVIDSYNSGEMTNGVKPTGTDVIKNIVTGSVYSNVKDASGNVIAVGVHDQLGDLNFDVSAENDSIADKKAEIEEYDREIKSNITDTKFKLSDGEEYTLEEAERNTNDRKTDLDKRKAQSKLERDRAAAEHIGSGN